VERRRGGWVDSEQNPGPSGSKAKGILFFVVEAAQIIIAGTGIKLGHLVAKVLYKCPRYFDPEVPLFITGPL